MVGWVLTSLYHMLVDSCITGSSANEGISDERSENSDNCGVVQSFQFEFLNEALSKESPKIESRIQRTPLPSGGTSLEIKNKSP
jgi:hypothetical protein